MEQNNNLPPRINIGLTRTDSTRSDDSSVTLVDTPRTLVDLNTPRTVVDSPIIRQLTTQRPNFFETPPRTPRNLNTNNVLPDLNIMPEPPPLVRTRAVRTINNADAIPFPINRNNQMNLDWLDEEIENQPARQRRRLDLPTGPRRQGRMGVAFEIHDYSHGVAKPQIVELYGELTGIPKTRYNPQTVKEYFKNKMIDLINQNPRYTPEEKEQKLNALNLIYSSRLEGHETYNPIEAHMMGYSVDYASMQDPVFQQIYIDTYLTDCATAYATGPALSCAGGTYERAYTSIAKAIQQRLLEPDVDGFNLTDEKKEEYTELFILYEAVPDEILFPVAREWLEKPDMPRGLEERKNSLREHIIQRVRELLKYQIQPGDRAYLKINHKVINDPYVVSELEKETPEFGGRRTRRRTRKVRKHRKTKRTKKSRKTKKRKTSTKKYLKRR